MIHVKHFGECLVPVFQNMIERNQNEDKDADSPVAYGLMRFALGAAYMAFHLVGSGYVSREPNFAH